MYLNLHAEEVNYQPTVAPTYAFDGTEGTIMLQT